MSLRTLKIFLLFFLVKESIEVSFECKFENEILYYVGTIYDCSADELFWNLNEPQINLINGTHESGKSNRDVKGLSIEPQNKNHYLVDFPQNIHNYFPNLKAILIWYSKISKISSNDLQHFPDLEYFGFHYSKIISIPGDLFKFNKKLKFVFFYGNQELTHVGNGLLEDLKDLKYAGFRQNKCIDMIAVTPEEIEELNEKLIEKCPPDYCPPSCAIDDIKKCFNEKINEQTKTIESNKNLNEQEFNDQRKIIEKQKLSIDNLEKKHNDDQKIIEEIKINLSNSQLELKQKIDDQQKINGEQKLLTDKLESKVSNQLKINNEYQKTIQGLQQVIETQKSSFDQMKKDSEQRTEYQNQMIQKLQNALADLKQQYELSLEVIETQKSSFDQMKKDSEQRNEYQKTIQGLQQVIETQKSSFDQMKKDSEQRTEYQDQTIQKLQKALADLKQQYKLSLELMKSLTRMNELKIKALEQFVQHEKE
jgi:hypothetical protein